MSGRRAGRGEAVPVRAGKPPGAWFACATGTIWLAAASCATPALAGLDDLALVDAVAVDPATGQTGLLLLADRLARVPRPVSANTP